MHTAPEAPTPATPTPCPWCGVPVVADRTPWRSTRPFAVAGVVVGELCPSCTAESRELDGEAAEAARDAHDHPSWA